MEMRRQRRSEKTYRATADWNRRDARSAAYWRVCLLALSHSVGHSDFMSDKELALDSIRRLPEDVRLETIAARLEFLAAIRLGLDQIERGETMPHEEVKRELASWLSK